MPYRVKSVDILRGLVMIIMALDHTRDFFHETAMTADPLNPYTTTVALTLTRWITHFCAPVFVLLSGLSAYLASQKRTPSEAGNLLVKRGIWLVIVEVVIITLGITFNPFYSVIILQVIWVIGWSMVLLGIVSRWSHKAVLIVGVVLFFGHNILDHIALPESGVANVAWKMLFTAMATVIPVTPRLMLLDLYAILPWTGVMFMGYSMGKLFTAAYPPEKRRKVLLYAGLSLIVLFFVLRFINIYGDPSPWQHLYTPIRTAFSFFNVSKYPPSLQYCCITLGPSLVLLSWLERVKSRWADVASVYGSVPFFYYVLHFYLLHILLVMVFYATGHHNNQIIDANSLFFFRPAVFGYGLPVVYAIWLGVVFVLYFPCRWFSNYKKLHHQWWLRYV